MPEGRADQFSLGIRATFAFSDLAIPVVGRHKCAHVFAFVKTQNRGVVILRSASPTGISSSIFPAV
jgi:hypothetical protein